jgi:mannose-6-phosphate isomerase-like protein (cupin superfamily)
MYYILPKLVRSLNTEKNNITEHKSIKIDNQLIEESIEFDSDSLLLPVELLEKIDKKKYPYQLIDKDSKNSEIINQVEGIMKISELDSKIIYGTRIEPGFCIILAQEIGSNYQNSVRKETSKELPRYESWYLFSALKMTLGVKEDLNIASYKESCEKIYALSKKLSKDLKTKKITFREANKQLENMIDVLRPDKHVNKIPLRANTILDLTKGGVTHSVEQDPTNPKGSLIFKVMNNHKNCSAKFDAYANGELSENDDLSKLDIEKYFENLETNIVDNNSRNRIKTSIKLKDLKGWKLNKIFNLTQYQTDELVLHKDYKIEELGFRHLFVREGKGIVKIDETKFEISQGESYILPYNAKLVVIRNTTAKTSTDEEPKLRLLLTYKREHLKK